MTDVLEEVRILATDPHVDWPPAATDRDMRGLSRWVTSRVGNDRTRAVAMARDAALVVRPRYGVSGEEVPMPADFLDAQLDVARQWLANATADLQVFAFSHVDPTRQLQAWEGFEEITDWWILEACQFAVLCVWSGTREGYVPVPPFAIASGRAVACAYRALVADGISRDEALTRITSLLRS